jgi:hypothetical protein
MVIGTSPHKGSKYCHYGLMLLRSLEIVQDVSPEIGDAPVTLISGMEERACCLPIYILIRAITLLWTDVTMQPFDCRKDQSKIVEVHLSLT